MVGASATIGGEDEYRYSLIGPRLWADAGHVYRPNLLTTAFFSSYWESLFLWGNSYLGGPAGRGLI